MTIDTVAVFHAGSNAVSSWCASEGIVAALSRMGYGVIDCVRPAWKTVDIRLVDRCDLILIINPEWIIGEIDAAYGKAWGKLRAPKIAWFGESAHRDDHDFDFGNIKRIADEWYFPAVQDANEFGGKWLPFGVDIQLFRPKDVPTIYEAGFVGQLYQKRIDYLSHIEYPIQKIEVKQHPHPRHSFSFLADAYCSTRILVNLPAYSRLLVARITEGMACRRLVITPAMDHPSALGNMLQFEDGKHLRYYDQNDPSTLKALIEYYTKNTSDADEIAHQGCLEVRKAHTLEARLQKIFGDIMFSAAPHAGTKTSIRSASINEPPKRYNIFTCWGTIVYYDPATKQLRHGTTDSRERGLFIEVAGQRGRLLVSGTEQTLTRLRYAPMTEPLPEPGQSSGAVEFIDGDEVLDCNVEQRADGSVLIRHGHNYLTADNDGIVRNDRSLGKEWEIFRLHPAVHPL